MDLERIVAAEKCESFLFGALNTTWTFLYQFKSPFSEGFEHLKGALGFHIAPSEKARMHYRDIKIRNLQHTNSAHVPAWDCVCAVTSEQLMLRYHRQTASTQIQIQTAKQKAGEEKEKKNLHLNKIFVRKNKSLSHIL